MAGCSTPGHSASIADYEYSELLEIRQSSLEALAKSFGLNEVPDVELVRFVARHESGEAVSSCLRELGIDAQSSTDGTGFLILGNPPEEQAMFIQESIYICLAKYSVDPRYNIKFNESQFQVLYDYFVGDLTNCLRQHGYAVKDDVPSFETFRETYMETGWSPYTRELVMSLGESELNKLFVACPQTPPDDVLYPFSPAVP